MLKPALLKKGLRRLEQVLLRRQRRQKGQFFI